jgi:hypothetical protein
MTPRPLGRIRDAETDRAEELYPFAAAAPAAVEHVLHLPSWLDSHDQGREGSCVGHAVALERAIVNTAELRVISPSGYRRYDPIAIWRAAKAIDEYPATKPGDDLGTSVRAAYEVARTQGLARVQRMILQNGEPHPVGAHPVDPLEGVTEYRWARDVDSIRAAIARSIPVAIGVDWFTGFDTPIVKGNRERWLPTSSTWGRVRGGHSVALVGASDRRQAFRLVNSWGHSYPPVWMPYDVMEHLLARSGEAALVTDRPGA